MLVSKTMFGTDFKKTSKIFKNVFSYFVYFSCLWGVGFLKTNSSWNSYVEIYDRCTVGHWYLEGIHSRTQILNSRDIKISGSLCVRGNTITYLGDPTQPSRGHTRTPQKPPRHVQKSPLQNKSDFWSLGHFWKVLWGPLATDLASEDAELADKEGPLYCFCYHVYVAQICPSYDPPKWSPVSGMWAGPLSTHTYFFSATWD